MYNIYIYIYSMYVVVFKGTEASNTSLSGRFAHPPEAEK